MFLICFFCERSVKQFTKSQPISKYIIIFLSKNIFSTTSLSLFLSFFLSLSNTCIMLRKVRFLIYLSVISRYWQQIYTFFLIVLHNRSLRIYADLLTDPLSDKMSQNDARLWRRRSAIWMPHAEEASIPIACTIPVLPKLTNRAPSQLEQQQQPSICEGMYQNPCELQWFNPSPNTLQTDNNLVHNKVLRS